MEELPGSVVILLVLAVFLVLMVLTVLFWSLKAKGELVPLYSVWPGGKLHIIEVQERKKAFCGLEPVQLELAALHEVPESAVCKRCLAIWKRK